MRLRRLRHPETWSGLALETATNLRPAALRQPPLSWELPVSSEVRVLWPETYDWSQTDRWVGTIADALGNLSSLRRANISQGFPRVVLAEIGFAGERRRVAIDYADSLEINRACADQVDVYFKMQFRRGGYDLRHVVAGGFVSNGRALLRYLPRLRRLRARERFRYDAYGAFSPGYASAVRRRAIELLRDQTQFSYEGGFEINRYSSHLVKAARARVPIDLPGNGPFCFRLVDYFAIGSAIVAAPHEAVMHVPLEAGEQLVYTASDLGDLPELVESLLHDEAKRERIAASARAYYDRYLHPMQLAAYYVHTTLRLTT